MNMVFTEIMFLVLNKRMEDIRDLLRAEIRTSAAELKVDIGKLDQRIERHENERRVVR